MPTAANFERALNLAEKSKFLSEERSARDMEAGFAEKQLTSRRSQINEPAAAQGRKGRQETYRFQSLGDQPGGGGGVGHPDNFCSEFYADNFVFVDLAG